METKEIYLEEIWYYYRKGELGIHFDKFVELAEKDPCFDEGVVADPRILKIHLGVVSSNYCFDRFISSVCRCVENNLYESLKLLLDSMDRIISFTDNMVSDRFLLLRRLNLKCYLLAREYGFFDSELEKRIICLQRLFRRQKYKIVYTGPSYESYCLQTNREGIERYWGYRQTIYFLRWNRRSRFKMLRGEWYNDCRQEAYKDFFKERFNDKFISDFLSESE